jgi:hypothetical protein
MFWAVHRSSSGALTVFAASGLHTHVVTGCSQVWVGTWLRPDTTCVCKPEAANTVLMMSGVPLETCWAFNEWWNNKFCYKVAYCWLFLLNHTTMHRSINIKKNTTVLISPQFKYSPILLLMWMGGYVWKTLVDCSVYTFWNLHIFNRNIKCVPHSAVQFLFETRCWYIISNLYWRCTQKYM